MPPAKPSSSATERSQKHAIKRCDPYPSANGPSQALSQEQTFMRRLPVLRL